MGPFLLLLLLLSSSRGRAGVHDIQGSCRTPIADDRRFEALR